MNTTNDMAVKINRYLNLESSQERLKNYLEVLGIKANTNNFVKYLHAYIDLYADSVSDIANLTNDVIKHLSYDVPKLENILIDGSFPIDVLRYLPYVKRNKDIFKIIERQIGDYEEEYQEMIINTFLKVDQTDSFISIQPNRECASFASLITLKNAITPKNIEDLKEKISVFDEYNIKTKEKDFETILKNSRRDKNASMNFNRVRSNPIISLRRKISAR